MNFAKSFDQYLPGHVTIYPIHKGHIPKFNVDVPLEVRPVLCYRKPTLVRDVQEYPERALKMIRRGMTPGKKMDCEVLSVVSAFLGDVRFFQKCPIYVTDMLIQLYLSEPELTEEIVAKERYTAGYFCIQGLANISMYCKVSTSYPSRKVGEVENFASYIAPIKNAANALSERLWRERRFYMQDIPAYNIAVLLLGLASCAPPPDIPSHLLRCCGYWWLNVTSSQTIQTVIATAVSNALYAENQSHTPVHLENRVFECTDGKTEPFAKAINERMASELCRGPHFQWTIHMVMVLTTHDDKGVCRCAAAHTDPTSLLLVELREIGFLKTVVRAAVDEFKRNGPLIRDGTVRSLGAVVNSLTNYCLVHDMYTALEDGLMELLKKCISGRKVPQDLVPYEFILQNMIYYVRRNPIIARIVSKRIPKLKNLKGFYFVQTQEYWVILSSITDAMKAIRKQCGSPDCPNASLSDVEWESVQTKACASCRAVYYCSRQCQSTDWTSHKILCYCWKREQESPKD